MALDLAIRLVLLAAFALTSTGFRANAQEPAFEAARTEAHQLFHDGKLKQSATKLLALVGQAPSATHKIVLYRDLAEVCATGYHWQCVNLALKEFQKVIPAVRSEAGGEIVLGNFLPEFILYELKMKLWYEDDAYAQQLLNGGAPFNITNVALHPSAVAELQLEFASYDIRRNDIRSAEQRISSAMFGMLLVDPKNFHAIGKIIVGLVERLIAVQDFVGASGLITISETFFTRSIPARGVLQAKYRMLLAQVLTLTNLADATANSFANAIAMWDQLEIDDDAKQHQLAMANSNAVAAYVLAGKLKEAKELHARHPLHTRRGAILQSAGFQSSTEFIFGLATIFLDAVSNVRPDTRWRPLFEKEIAWRMTELESTEARSYQHFALGVLQLSAEELEKGQNSLVFAASERLKNFEKITTASSERHPFPNLVDKIIILVGLHNAAARGDPPNRDLIVRGSEVLGRTIRQQLVEIAALLASQQTSAMRRSVHAYFHLVGRKREWEIEKIGKLLTNELTESHKKEVLGEYGEVADSLAKLSARLFSEKGPTTDLAAPSLQNLQRSLRAGEAFIAYFPTIERQVGKICVQHDRTFYSASPYGPEVVSDVRVLSTAVSEQPKTEIAARQFPAPAARRLTEFLFGGLGECLRPGTHITIAMPVDFASIPIGALLRHELSHYEDFNLTTAPWLIRDLSFSVVVSARHFLATRALLSRERAPRAFLGIGDPALDVNDIVSSNIVRSSLKARSGALQFDPLPETATEIKAVASLFSAPDMDILLNKRGTEENFRARPLADFDVIHFATHGIFREDIAGLPDSGLLLTPGSERDNLDDGVLSASEISRLSLNARLVVLSACNTARYELADVARGVQDLQAAFTIAGVPSLLGSLWRIDSKTTEEIVTLFFREWQASGSGASESLARATREFLRNASPIHQHPYFWAPFLVAGDGATSVKERKQTTSIALEQLPDFHQAGSIVDAKAYGADIIIGMIGEYDGQKMNGILSRRALNGVERWRIGSREIGMGNIAVQGRTIYVTGFITSENSYPLVRSFDGLKGQLRWKTEFPDLRGYMFTALGVVPQGPLLVAYPTLALAGEKAPAFVIALNDQGRMRSKTEIQIPPRPSDIGSSAVLMVGDKRITVAFNQGSSVRFRPGKKSVLGFPQICREGASITLVELNAKNMRIVSSRSKANFRATSLALLGDNLFVGGEVLDECSLHGAASVLRFASRENGENLWTDDSPFKSTVSSISASKSRLLIAVEHERRLGVKRVEPGEADYANKRWGDDVGTQRDGSLLYMSTDGTITERRYISAGMNLYLRGVVFPAERLTIFGTVGGVPAFNIH